MGQVSDRMKCFLWWGVNFLSASTGVVDYKTTGTLSCAPQPFLPALELDVQAFLPQLGNFQVSLHVGTLLEVRSIRTIHPH